MIACAQCSRSRSRLNEILQRHATYAHAIYDAKTPNVLIYFRFVDIDDVPDPKVSASLGVHLYILGNKFSVKLKMQQQNVVFVSVHTDARKCTKSTEVLLIRLMLSHWTGNVCIRVGSRWRKVCYVWAFSSVVMAFKAQL